MTDLTLIYPEIFLALSALAILVIDMFTPFAKRQWTHRITLFSLAIVFLILLANAQSTAIQPAFYGHYIVDFLSNGLKALSTLILLIILVLGRNQLLQAPTNDPKGALPGEFYSLAMFTLLGQFIMLSGHSMVTIYLGIELMSLSLYALVAMRRDDPKAIEAALKYFILGALASGLLLYGISLIYGATGSLKLLEILQISSNREANTLLLTMGVVFIIAGISFKLGLVPFHMWVPDVYQGAPMITTLLISTAPKIAVLVILLRFFVQGIFSVAFEWQYMLMIVAVLSVIVGNLAAIAQTNMKRLLAYSAIAQIGFMMLAFISVWNPGQNDETLIRSFTWGYGTSLFYLASYICANLVAFGVLLYLSNKDTECAEMTQLAGLNQRAPWLAFLMLLAMFSMAGIPLLAGFYAKFLVLQSLIHAGHIVLPLIAILFSLIGAFYYLKVIKTMYFETPSTTIETISHNPSALFALSALGILLLAIGIYPSPLVDYFFVALRLGLLGIS